jgi:hypothetical protein
VHVRRLIACSACVAAGAAAASAAQVLAAAATSPKTYALPPGTLRLSDTRLLASAREKVTFTVKLTHRAVDDGRLELTLPRQWTGRSGVSDLPYASVPSKGSASSSRATVRRSGRVVTFAFKEARTGELARFTVADRGLPARAYSLPYRWRENGAVRRTGTARVTVYVTPRPPRR